MLDRLTPTGKKIVRILAEKGCKCHRDLLEIASKKPVSQALRELLDLKMTEVRYKESIKYKGKKRRYYGLTWKGLAYALSENIISPKKGYDVMTKNKMKFPALPFDYTSVETAH